MNILEFLLAVLAALSLTVSVALATFAGLGWVAWTWGATVVASPVLYWVLTRRRRIAADDALIDRAGADR